MALTPEQREILHKMKTALGIDTLVGENLSARSRTQTTGAGVRSISPAEGKRISEEHLNPEIEFVAGNL